MHPGRSSGPGPSTCLGPTRTQPWRGPEPPVLIEHERELDFDLEPDLRDAARNSQIQDGQHDPHDLDCGVSCLETDSKTYRQTDRQTDRQTNRQTDRQTDRQTNERR